MMDTMNSAGGIISGRTPGGASNSGKRCAPCRVLFVILFFAAGFLPTSYAAAQLRGNCRDDRFQVDCMIPEGWFAETKEYGLLLRSEQPGCTRMIVVFTSAGSADSLQALIGRGFDDGGGTQLSLHGGIEQDASGEFEAQCSGIVDWQAAEAVVQARRVSGQNACIVYAVSGTDEQPESCRAVARAFIRRVASHAGEAGR